MQDIEKYQPQQLLNDIDLVEGASFPADNATPNVFQGVLRRWYIVLLALVLICGGGIPAVWYLIKPQYRAVAAIRVAPIIPSILFGDKDSEGVIPMYENFMNTQADLITSNQVLQRVADDLADKKLKLFEEKNLFSKTAKVINPIDALRHAIMDGIITVNPGRRSELIKVSMDSISAQEAEITVNAIVKAYMAIEGSRSTEGGDQRLSVLEDESRTLADKLQRQREVIRLMAEEYGTVALTGRQDMMLQRVADLQTEITKIEATRLALEVKVKILEQTENEAILPDGLVERRHAFISADPTVQTLSQKLAQLEENLIVAQQQFAATNPELKRHNELLEAFKKRLEERREELGKTFDENIAIEIGKNSGNQLAEAKAALEQTIIHEKILQAKLTEENADTIELGRKQLAIQDQQEQLDLSKELYDVVRRRIQELEMERKRPARISVAYNATSAPIPNKRIKFTAALVFGALACGVFLAFLRDKADRSLRTPDDIVRRIGVPVIGTTTSPAHLDRKSLPEYLANDYQTIRANLGLFSGGEIPKKLVVTSATMGEGKTTFAINLATSLAKAGDKVLLIDGDIRKPDIGRILHLPDKRWGLTDVLLGLSEFQNALYSMPQNGLDVLATDGRNVSRAIDVLRKPQTAECINTICQNYDHIIIDTSPVLSAPDVLLWAKIADAVVLCSFAGQTAGPDLKETIKRLIQVNARVLGNVLSNVRVDNTYYRYGYAYNKRNATEKNNVKSDKNRPLLLATQDEGGDIDGSDA